MSVLGGKEAGRREESKGWFGGAIWVCWGLDVVVERVEGVEASDGVYAYVGAWLGAMLSKAAGQVWEDRWNIWPFWASSVKRFFRS